MASQKKTRPLLLAGLLGMAALLLLQPAQVTQGALDGLEDCCRVMIPALFPFLVISQCFVASGTAAWAGVVFTPIGRLLGIRTPEAGCAFLLAGLGGFASASACLGRMTEEKILSQRDCAIAVCACAVVSPSFCVAVIGTLALGSAAAGWIILFSVWISSILCAFAASLLLRPEGSAKKRMPPQQEPFSFAAAVNRATGQMVQICGFVLVFAVLYSVLAPFLPDAARPVLAALLELSAGAKAAAAGHSVTLALLTCCGMGLCGLLQVRSLLPEGVSLAPLLLTRPAHFLLSLTITKTLLAHLPGALATALGSGPVVAVSRLPWQSGFFLFLFLALGCRAIGSAAETGFTLRHDENCI